MESEACAVSIGQNVWLLRIHGFGPREIGLRVCVVDLIIESGLALEVVKTENLTWTYLHEQFRISHRMAFRALSCNAIFRVQIEKVRIIRDVVLLVAECNAFLAASTKGDLATHS